MTGPFKIRLPGQRICFWGARDRVNAPDTDIDRQLVESGANSGNLFIGAGLFRGTECASKDYHPGFGTMSPEETSERYDVVFIAASNFVGKAVDLTSAYDYLSKTNLPIICFGLGSQFLPGEEVKLQPGTDRMLRLMSERSGSIGVRGAFTAELLEGIGIRNLSLVGCPSLMSLTSAAAVSLTSKKTTTMRMAVNFSNNVRRHALNQAALAATENALFRRVVLENSYYVLQNETPEITAMRPAPGQELQARNARATVTEIFGARDIEPLVERYLSSRLRMFFDVDAWVWAMTDMTSAIGSRFHGNVAAILGGTRALILAHDMRTQELCETFRIPYLAVDRPIASEECMEALLNADYGPFLRNMTKMHAEWRLFLTRNDLAERTAA